jgi:uncharacterized membrane protein YkoI
MNRNFKTLALTAAAIMTLGVASVSFAATNPAASTAPAAAKVKATTTTAKTAAKGPKISQDQATQIALKAHSGATVASTKLVGKAYVIKLTSSTNNYTLKVGANTGRILKDKATKAATTDTSTKAAAPAAKK